MRNVVVALLSIVGSVTIASVGNAQSGQDNPSRTQCDRDSRDADTAAMPPSQDCASASTRKSHRWPRLAQHARLLKRASAASNGTRLSLYQL